MNTLAQALEPADRTQFQVDRLAFFSDAVFAIAITLLALNIHAPAITGGEPDEHELLLALAGMIPHVVGFVVSFLVIGNYWRAHHRLFRWVRGYTPALVTINLILLLCVSFIPAPTAFYSDFSAHRVPLIFYAGSLSAVGVMNSLLWRYLIRHRELLDPAAPPLELRVGAGRSLVIPVVCTAAISLSFYNPWMARLALLTIPVWTRLYTWLVRRFGTVRHPAAA